MPNRTVAVVVLVGLVFLWGVMGITETDPAEQGDRRFVVENQYDESRTITVTITSHSSGMVTTETQRLQPGQQWVVATLDTAVLSDGYAMNVSGEHSSHFESSRGGIGATLIEIGGGHTATCGGSVTCYK